MDTEKEKELIGRVEALEAISDKQLKTLESAVYLMKEVMGLQQRILEWAKKTGYEEGEKK